MYPSQERRLPFRIGQWSARVRLCNLRSWVAVRARRFADQSIKPGGAPQGFPNIYVCKLTGGTAKISAETTHGCDPARSSYSLSFLHISSFRASFLR